MVSSVPFIEEEEAISDTVVPLSTVISVTFIEEEEEDITDAVTPPLKVIWMTFINFVQTLLRSIENSDYFHVGSLGTQT